MNKFFALGLALVTAVSAFAAEAIPTFNATLTVGKDSRFVLIGQDGKSSSWLQVGDSFAGYTIKAYDAKAGALDLEKDGKNVRVTLAADAKVADGPATPAAVSLADAEKTLGKMHFDEVLTHVIDRQKKVVEAQFSQMVNRMTAQGVSADDAQEFKKKLLDEIGTVMDPEQLKPAVTKFFSEVYNKDELDAMTAFYSTPIGEQIATKQSALQDKIGGYIQQRVMESMPKIQQLGAEFRAQQQAKAAAQKPVQPAPSPAVAPTPAPKS